MQTATAISNSSPALARLLDGLDAIHEAERRRIGPKDARRLAALLRLSRRCEARGRRKIKEAREAAEWREGIGLLASHYILEMANGHAVMHGALRAHGRGLDPARYEWRNSVTAEDWRIDHNEVHHPHTNVVDRDPDFDLLYFRFSDRRRWRLRHAVQVPLLLALPLTTTWFIPTVAAAGRARHEQRPIRSWRTFEPVVRKVAREWVTNYVEPARERRYLQVALGHAIAKLVSNTIIGAALFASHHGEAALDLGDDPESTRAEAYLRQILCTVNFHLPDRRWEDIHLRGVTQHIEHHLFPDLPVERLAEVEPKVRALCEELGIPHETTTLVGAFIGIVRVAAHYALPIAAPTRGQRERRALYERLCREYREWRAAQPRQALDRDRTYTISLTRSGRSIQVAARETLLDALEREGVEVSTGCRKGACQTCLTPRMSGRTTQDPRGVRSHVNLCVARPRSDVALDL